VPVSFRLAGSCFATAIVALSLAASSVAAAAWQPSVALTSSGFGLMWQGGVATTSSGAFLVAYEDGYYGQYSAYLRRSTDHGTTWAKATRLSPACFSGGPQIAADGNEVDAVWIETPFCDLSDTHRIAYRRSNDGGRTFGTITTIAWTSAHSFPSVARGTDGTVLVGWTDDDTSTIYARTSVDGGTTFGPAIKIAQTTNEAYESLPGDHDGFARVALGSGVSYVGYYGKQHKLYVRMSTDHGSTWSPPTELSASTDGYSWWSLSAEGTHAVAAFPEIGTNEWTRYRLTTDAGQTWSAPVDLSSPSGPDSSYPSVLLRDGVLRAVYSRMASNGWYAAFYRKGLENGSLSAPVKVSPRGEHADAYPAGAEASGSATIVAYFLLNASGDAVYVRAR